MVALRSSRSPVSELSERKSCIPPTLRIGNSAMPVTMKPTPPTACRAARQKMMPRGVSSRPDITVEPVVVIPDIASKNASVSERL